MGRYTMNKGIVFLMITMVVWLQPLYEQTTEDIQEIPDEAIRLRILANSDEEEDQQIKRQVRDEVNAYINELVVEIADIEEARQTIRQHVPRLEEVVESTLEEAGLAEVNYTVEYRSDVAFPMKRYDDYIYPAGEYEAVLITLGKGEGANWWCVLFPPLCFLDFSNGSTVADADIESDEDELDEIDLTEAPEDMEEEENEASDDEVEVKFFLFEWLGIS